MRTLALLITFSFFSLAKGSEYNIDVGEKFESPNGIYTAQLESGLTDNLEITNNKSHKAFYGTVDTPLLSLKWTPDSKAIVVVEHMAGGSSAFIIYLLMDATTRFDGTSPSNSTYCRVLKIEPKKERVLITYLLSTGRRNLNWISSFEMDQNTGKKSHVTSRPITQEKARQLSTKPRSSI